MHGGDIWMGNSIKLEEFRLQVVVAAKADQSSFIAHLVTIIWSTKYSDAFTIMLDNISLIFDFMGTNHQFQIIRAEEIFGDIRAKRESDSPLRWALS